MGIRATISRAFLQSTYRKCSLKTPDKERAKSGLFHSSSLLHCLLPHSSNACKPNPSGPCAAPSYLLSSTPAWAERQEPLGACTGITLCLPLSLPSALPHAPEQPARSPAPKLSPLHPSSTHLAPLLLCTQQSVCVSEPCSEAMLHGSSREPSCSCDPPPTPLAPAAPSSGRPSRSVSQRAALPEQSRIGALPLSRATSPLLPGHPGAGLQPWPALGLQESSRARPTQSLTRLCQALRRALDLS